MQNAFERSRSHAEVQLGACNHAAHIHTKVLLCTSQEGNAIARAWQTEIKNKLVKRVSVETKKKKKCEKTTNAKTTAPTMRRSARRMQLCAANIWTVFGRSPLLGITITKTAKATTTAMCALYATSKYACTRCQRRNLCNNKGRRSSQRQCAEEGSNKHTHTYTFYNEKAIKQHELQTKCKNIKWKARDESREIIFLRACDQAAYYTFSFMLAQTHTTPLETLALPLTDCHLRRRTVVRWQWHLRYIGTQIASPHAPLCVGLQAPLCQWSRRRAYAGTIIADSLSYAHIYRCMLICLYAYRYVRSKLEKVEKVNVSNIVYAQTASSLALYCIQPSCVRWFCALLLLFLCHCESLFIHAYIAIVSWIRALVQVRVRCINIELELGYWRNVRKFCSFCTPL